MNLYRYRRLAFPAAALCAVLGAATPAQDRPVVSRDVLAGGPESSDPSPVPPAPASGTRIADGSRHGLPVETYAVVPGTRFLVRLDQEINSKQLHRNDIVKVRTLEPLEAGSGIYLPSGAQITGHVSRVEPAGATGRAKIWLTFDEIRTRFGVLPIVAEVSGVPGDHSIREGGVKDGIIEGRPGASQKDAAQAAAAGAAMGAVKGVKDKDKKEAAEGAALAALEAYLMESGRGQELDLPPGSKLELELDRALYLVKE